MAARRVRRSGDRSINVILEDYLCAIDAANERVKRCEEAMGELLAT